MNDRSSQLASAIVLADSAFEMLVDTATVLKDAGEQAFHDEFQRLAEAVSASMANLRQRKVELEAANDNGEG